MKEHLIKITNNNVNRSTFSNFLAGLGIYHSIYNENSNFQTACALLFPAIYIGYHSFKNKDNIVIQIKKFKNL